MGTRYLQHSDLSGNRCRLVSAYFCGYPPFLVSWPYLPHPERSTNLRHFYRHRINNLPAELYRAMGRYGEAEPLLARSLHIREVQLGADHPDTATSLNNLALLYRAMGRYAEAEPLFLRSLHIQEARSGSDTATSLHNLALLYQAMGRYAEAEPLRLRCLEIERRVLGETHPQFAASLHNLAALYYAMDRYAEAAPPW